MKNYIILALSIVTLSSCNFYKPAMINAPVLEEKGELNLGISAGNGTDVTASYSITNHLAVSASLTSNLNVSTTTTSSTGEESTFNANNLKYDVALGYFNSQEDAFNYNFFAGYSAGQTGALLSGEGDIIFLDEFFISAQYTSFFVQGAGFSNVGGDNYIGLVAKVTALEFSKFKTSTLLNNTSDFFPSDKTQTVGQVGIQYNYKGEKFGFSTQLQYAFTDSNDSYFTLRQAGIHVGAYFRLSEMFKKQ